MSDRIPAWKRLGLKLKYAKERPDPAELLLFQRAKQEQQIVSNSKPPGLDAKSRPTKRRRLNGDESSQIQNPESYINGHSQHEFSRQADHDTRSVDTSAAGPRVNGQATHESALKKRKHVSFAREKTLGENDLHTNENIPSNASAPIIIENRVTNGDQHETTATTTNTTPANDKSESGESMEPSETSATTKKTKTKSKVNKKQKPQPSGTKPTAALEYLSQHHEHRDLWKFNKNRDIWILSHAQDVEAIPRSHDLALAGYVHGLPQQAASRNRLLSECKTSLESTTTEVASSRSAEAKKAFLNAMENAKSSTKDETLAEQVQEFPRSLLLLWALGATEPLTSSRPRADKKSRTAAPIELSTSEEDDSSSSSESSDESDSEEVRKAGDDTKGLGREVRSSSSNDDTSSSGSDDGTSSSDSDTSTDSD